MYANLAVRNAEAGACCRGPMGYERMSKSGKQGISRRSCLPPFTFLPFIFVASRSPWCCCYAGLFGLTASSSGVYSRAGRVAVVKEVRGALRRGRQHKVLPDNQQRGGGHGDTAAE